MFKNYTLGSTRQASALKNQCVNMRVHARSKKLSASKSEREYLQLLHEDEMICVRVILYNGIYKLCQHARPEQNAHGRVVVSGSNRRTVSGIVSIVFQTRFICKG